MFDIAEIKETGFFTTLNRDTDKMLMVKALGNADMKGEELEREPMLVSDVMIHMVPVKSDTDEETLAPRTVLISPDGKTAAFVSDGILSSLKNLIFVYGELPWKPALKVRASLVKTRKGYRTYNLTIEE